MEDRSVLAQRVAEMSNAFFAVSNDVVRGKYATYVVNPDAPVIRDANHAQDVTCTTEADLDRWLAEMDEVLDASPHRAFRDLPNTPAPVLGRLAYEGYHRDDGVLLFRDSDRPIAHKPFSVRRVETEEDWRAFSGLEWANREEDFTKRGVPIPGGLVEQFHRIKRANAAEVHYWLVDVDRAPRAYCSSWPGVGGIGLIEDLYTHPDYRHRGIATALIAHCWDDAVARGAERCAIPANPRDTPKDMYFALGFTPIATSTIFWKNTQPATRNG